MAELAVAILVLPDKRIVLQRRGKDAPISPGLLGFFGGHLDDHEKPDQAVVREIDEETSLKPTLDQFQRVASYTAVENRTFHLYKLDIENADFDVFEGDQAETYSLEELMARDDVTPSCRMGCQKYQQLMI